MTDQLDIGKNCVHCGLPLDDHWLASCPDNTDGTSGPITWDGEPLYSTETVREGLFDPRPFEQIPGQMGFGADPDVELRQGLSEGFWELWIGGTFVGMYTSRDDAVRAAHAPYGDACRKAFGS